MKYKLIDLQTYYNMSGAARQGIRLYGTMQTLYNGGKKSNGGAKQDAVLFFVL